jgi:uncharacterized protein
MPATLTYPGLYVEELPSGVHPITGVSPSDTAFIDRYAQGPVGVATRVRGFDEFLRRFGPPEDTSPAGYGVMQFFANGGQVAWIVRVLGKGAQKSSRILTGGSPPSDTLLVSAVDEGDWGDSLQVAVDWEREPSAGPPTVNEPFNLVVRRIGEVGGVKRVIVSEVYRDLTMDTNNPSYVVDVTAAQSSLVTVENAPGGLGQRPQPTGAGVTKPGNIASVLVPDPTDPSKKVPNPAFQPLANGAPGAVPTADELVDGLEALKRMEPDHASLLCIPGAATLDGSSITSTPSLTKVAGEVATFCEDFRCFYLMDIPRGVDTPDRVSAWLNANTLRDRNAAVYFPRITIVDPDPLRTDAQRDIASSGTIAGLCARMDGGPGIWRAPAGTETQLRSIVRPSGSTRLNDDDSATLNPLGVNVLRTLPVYGSVCWGARTLYGADVQASEWKYVPVRRTALYIEESLVRGLRWVVFAGNGPALWAEIRLNVGAFMQGMFRQGAFQGLTPRDAYLVKCDEETTLQADIDRGIVNVLVGFAPLKPAEFVVIQLQQIARPPEA